MIQAIGDVFGYIMYFCYKWIQNYGWSIIVFTLITKIILLPVSIMVQKNSIKMVEMYPEMNRIKAKYFGNNDMISEEQYKLYKKKKYNPMLDLVPVILQLIILMGVVDVIYKPLRHLFHAAQADIQPALDAFCEITKASTGSGSLQVQLVNYLHTANASGVDQLRTLLSSGSLSDGTLLSKIDALNMHFCGFNLGVIPIEAKGVALLVPVLAAASSWLMCFTQNKSNVLQSEQSKTNQIVTLLISVGLSLYLGLFVPAGVGFYWVLSNLFSIVQMYALNAAINPKKYIDYDALEESKKELNKVLASASEAKKNRTKEEITKEKADYKRFRKYDNKQLVFYSEKKGFYKYFKDVIETILRKTDIVIHYITSDINDDVFDLQSDNFRVYYIGDNKLIVLMMQMDCDIMVMTMPDLQRFQIKRSLVRKDIEYIYMDHAVASANLTLRKHALDNFDTIFATNELMKNEMREMEKVYDLKEKTIVEYGYSLIDNMIENYEKQHAGDGTADSNAAGDSAIASNAGNGSAAVDAVPNAGNGSAVVDAASTLKVSTSNKVPEILIAPSWQEDNIMDSYIEKMLDNLLGHGYHVTVRPHPQYVRHFADRLNALNEQYKSHEDFELQLDFSSNKTVFDADVLITDWSGIAYEYSFTTLKPTLFINTPMKIMNPDYKEISITPFDIEARDQVGISVETDQLDGLADVVNRLLTEELYSKESLKKVREKYLYNVGTSANVGAKYIIKRLIEISKQG